MCAAVLEDYIGQYYMQTVCNGMRIPLHISLSSSDSSVVEVDRESVLQYMVVYQCVLAVLNVAAFWVDGSSTSNLQVKHGLISLQSVQPDFEVMQCLIISH